MRIGYFLNAHVIPNAQEQLGQRSTAPVTNGSKANEALVPPATLLE